MPSIALIKIGPGNIFQRFFFATVFCFFMLGGQRASASDDFDGFWSCTIEYHCSWGWKDFRRDVIFSSFGTGMSTANVEGGELKINHFFNGDEYPFEIADDHCTKKGTLTRTVFAGVEYLRGEWITNGNNSAAWGTGLCCNGRIELSRKVKEAKPKDKLPIAKTELKKEPEKAVQQKFPDKPAAGEKYVLKNVIFELGSSKLLPESFSELNKLYELLEADKKMVIQLDGHTDIVGPHKGNMNLSKQRVKAIKKHLTKRGISGSRIKLKWYGDTKPILTSGTLEERKVNRRVELLVLEM